MLSALTPVGLQALVFDKDELSFYNSADISLKCRLIDTIVRESYGPAASLLAVGAISINVRLPVPKKVFCV